MNLAPFEFMTLEIRLEFRQIFYALTRTCWSAQGGGGETRNSPVTPLLPRFSTHVTEFSSPIGKMKTSKRKTEK